jgi:hypothetical protein
MCSRCARPFALALVSHTSGFATVANPWMGPATLLETFSASAIAIRLGTSSPTTMEKYETISVMSTVASASALPACMPKPTSHVASGPDRLVAANADEKNPTSVIATWIAARNPVGLSITFAALAARASPSSASWSSSTFFAVERAISDIEKYPLTNVSNTVTVIDSAMSMRVSATS